MCLEGQEVWNRISQRQGGWEAGSYAIQAHESKTKENENSQMRERENTRGK